MKKFINALITLTLIAVSALSFMACSVSNGREFVEVYETTGTKSKLLARQSDIAYAEQDKSSPNVTVTVNENKKGQDFLGLGASMTHSSAYLLMQLNAELRKEVLTELFGGTGANFNFIRVPIGSSDYVETDNFFTCDDLEDANAEDLSLSKFNLDKDFNILSVLKEIKDINPNLLFVAVPWSAPAWMKSNKSLFGGELDAKYNSVYADYMLKFVTQYKNKGIDFNYISILNEPFIANIGYPHMQMDGEQAAQIIEILGKKLKDASMKNIKIMAYEHNYSASKNFITPELYIDAVLDNKASAKYISGVSFHGYGNNGFDDFADGLDYVHKYDKETYITEVTEHSGSVDFASNISYAMKNVLINPINRGLSAAMFWNFALTSDGKPVSGNNAICYGLVSIDDEGDNWHYKKNSAYYAMAHISKFAYKVDGKFPRQVKTESSNESKIIASALLRADGRLIIVAHNTNDSTYENVDFIIGGRSVTYRLMPQSVVTLVV